MSTPEERFKERLQWFYDRVGQRVWRPKTGCECESCVDAYKNGLEIIDKEHAYYLRDIEAAYGVESKGGYWYFDTKEERDEFEKSISNG